MLLAVTPGFREEGRSIDCWVSQDTAAKPQCRMWLNLMQATVQVVEGRTGRPPSRAGELRTREPQNESSVGSNPKSGQHGSGVLGRFASSSISEAFKDLWGTVLEEARPVSKGREGAAPRKSGCLR